MNILAPIIEIIIEPIVFGSYILAVFFYLIYKAFKNQRIDHYG